MQADLICVSRLSLVNTVDIPPIFHLLINSVVCSSLLFYIGLIYQSEKSGKKERLQSYHTDVIIEQA